MEPQKYKSFLRNYLISSSLYDFVFAYAIYNVFFSLRGLSVFQISILLSWWALTAMLFEIPSGALADYWSRKKMLMIAPLVKSFCFVIWFLADGNFYLYALGFLFWSIGSSFVSGTTESLLYDELVVFKKEDEYEKVLGKKKTCFHIALAISMILGGFIAYYNLDWAIIFSVIPLLLSAIFAAFIKETAKIKSTEEIHYFEYIKIAYREVKGNKILLFLFAYSFGLSIFGNLEEFDQLYYQIAGLPIFAFGLVGFLWSILNSIGAYYAHNFKNSIWIFYVFPLLAAVLLFFVGYQPNILTIGVLLFSYFITSPLRILIDSKIQHNISSVGRATVTSISNLLICFFGVILTPIFGVIGKVWNLQAIYISTSIFLLFFVFWTFFNRKIFYKK
ncbi:MAG: MFS transporter [Candidatus Uhrbacteria bacterium]